MTQSSSSPHADPVKAILIAQGLEARAHELNALLDMRSANDVMADALAAAKRISVGKSLSPLDGIPVLIKDNIDVAGLRTSVGTPAMANFQPEVTALAVQRLLDAGMICLGKANMHELALGITSNNAFTGPVRNPIDPTRIAGGSSGGSAAAVALGYVPVSICSDTGGSSRIPAALCGVVGYRPTFGRYPMQGVWPLSPSRDAIGIIANSVALVAAVDSVMAADNSSPAKPANTRPRIGVPQGAWMDDVQPEIAAAMSTFQQRKDCEFVPVDLGAMIELDDRCGFLIAIYETVVEWRRLCQEHLPMGFDAWVDTIASPDVREIMISASRTAPIPAVAYREAIDVLLPQLQEGFAKLFKDNQFDALLTPVTPLTAAPIGEDLTVMLNGAEVPTFPTFTRMCRPFSMAGLPSISLPSGDDSKGLPIGLMLTAAAGRDRDLLSLAARFSK